MKKPIAMNAIVPASHESDMPEPDYEPKAAKYCPVCEREIIPIKEWDMQDNEWVYIYVHDNRMHTEDDLIMFDIGMQ